MLELPRHKAQRRLILVALLGVGVPLVVLAGFAILQTSQIDRYLSESNADYGAYAAGLVANTLSNQTTARINQAATYARMASTWGGSSGRYLPLLASADPLLGEPFLIPDVEVLRAAQGDSLAPVFPSDAGSAYGGNLPWTAATAIRGPDGLETVSIAAPVDLWRDIIGTVYDTVFVIPPREGEGAYALAPLIGFGGRVVAVGGWPLDLEIFDAGFFEQLLANEVFAEPSVYRTDRMAHGLSLTVLDHEDRKIFRSRPLGGGIVWVEAPVGALLPGWRVAAGPSKGSAYLSLRRLLTAEYVLMFFLVAFSIAALWFAVRQASEQIRLAEAKSGFLANVSHELKTPLSLIRLAGETMELGRVRNEEERAKFLQVINRECQRLTHLINNVLDFAKIEAGRKEFHFRPTNLSQIVRHTVEAFETQFEEKGFTVEVDVPEDLEPVEVDREAITQCLVNLIDNAMKYSKEERRIGLRARVEPPGEKGARGEARLAVSDRGIGLSARDRQRIFEKFTRVESGLVHDVKGSGLGLSLVLHIVEAHGGRVEVQSAPGRGSTFTLVFPARREEEPT